MNAADIIAFTADADTWCPKCAREVYGDVACGRCPNCHYYLFPAIDFGLCQHCEYDYGKQKQTDREGNMIHPVFATSWSEWAGSGLYCCKCHDEIISKAESV